MVRRLRGSSACGEPPWRRPARRRALSRQRQRCRQADAAARGQQGLLHGGPPRRTHQILASLLLGLGIVAAQRAGALLLWRWVHTAAVEAWQHSPASLRQGRPSIAHQLGDQCLHPAFAGGDSSCGHALPSRWRRETYRKSAKGNPRDLPGRQHPNIPAAGAHPHVRSLQRDDFVCAGKHVRRHPRALRLVHARVCVPLPLHAGLVCGVWRSGGLSLCCCCWLWSLSLFSGICCWPPSLDPVPAPGPTRRSHSAVKSSCLPSTRLTTNAPSNELVPYDQHQHQHQRNSKGCQTGDGARAAAGVRRKHGARLTACRSRRAAGT